MGLLSAADRAELENAFRLLEHPGLAVRLAGIAGEPFQRVLRVLPSFANRRLHRAVERAITKCLDIAVDSLDQDDPGPSSSWVPKIITGVTGGVGGLFGVVALPLELPLTTMVMLRAMAEIARDYGEDLKSLESRLACLEVLAFSGPSASSEAKPGKTGRLNLGYYATRALISRLTQSLSNLVVQNGTVEVSSPIVSRLLAEIVSRFGWAVSERAAASAIPIVGAFGGATVNMIFMDHFQQLARGHFAVRRLERRYGDATVQAAYRQIVESPGEPAL